VVGADIGEVSDQVRPVGYSRLVSASQPPDDSPGPSEPTDRPADPAAGAGAPARSPDPVGERAKRSDPLLGGTRLSATWKVLAAALILLVLLLVFILLNLQRVEVNFYGVHTRPPLAVALLLAVVLGAALVFVIGTARILQVRARARRAGSSPPPRTNDGRG
jgi:uncharacterized integral membrane protein